MARKRNAKKSKCIHKRKRPSAHVHFNLPMADAACYPLKNTDAEMLQQVNDFYAWKEMEAEVSTHKTKEIISRAEPDRRTKRLNFFNECNVPAVPTCPHIRAVTLKTEASKRKVLRAVSRRTLLSKSRVLPTINGSASNKFPRLVERTSIDFGDTIDRFRKSQHSRVVNEPKLVDTQARRELNTSHRSMYVKRLSLERILDADVHHVSLHSNAYLNFLQEYRCQHARMSHKMLLRKTANIWKSSSRTFKAEYSPSSFVLRYQNNVNDSQKNRKNKRRTLKREPLETPITAERQALPKDTKRRRQQNKPKQSSISLKRQPSVPPSTIASQSFGPNMYMNFLRAFRRRNRDLDPKEQVMVGAATWRRMTDRERQQYKQKRRPKMKSMININKDYIMATSSCSIAVKSSKSEQDIRAESNSNISSTESDDRHVPQEPIKDNKQNDFVLADQQSVHEYKQRNWFKYLDFFFR